MNCKHDWKEIDWTEYPTFLIPPELRGKMPEAKVCRMCWASDDKGITKILEEYQTIKEEKEEIRKARIL